MFVASLALMTRALPSRTPVPVTSFRSVAFQLCIRVREPRARHDQHGVGGQRDRECDDQRRAGEQRFAVCGHTCGTTAGAAAVRGMASGRVAGQRALRLFRMCHSVSVRIRKSNQTDQWSM